MITWYHRLRRAQEGITAVEFAIAAPAFLLMLFGIIEFSLLMYASSVLEGATATSARTGKTGYIQLGMTREEYIISVVNDQSSGLLDSDHLTIETRVYGSFDQIGQPEPLTNDVNHNGTWDPGDDFEDINGNGTWDTDMGSAGLGGAGDVVVYTVTYPWRIFTPLMKPFFNEGQFELQSSVVIRNEPWEIDT